jgi:hypothetical protein
MSRVLLSWSSHSVGIQDVGWACLHMIKAPGTYGPSWCLVFGILILLSSPLSLNFFCFLELCWIGLWIRMLSYSFSFGKFASVNSSQRDFIIAQAWNCDQSSTQYAKYYTSAKARTHGQIEFSQFTLHVHHLQWYAHQIPWGQKPICSPSTCCPHRLSKTEWSVTLMKLKALRSKATSSRVHRHGVRNFLCNLSDLLQEKLWSLPPMYL